MDARLVLLSLATDSRRAWRKVVSLGPFRAAGSRFTQPFSGTKPNPALINIGEDSLMTNYERAFTSREIKLINNIDKLYKVNKLYKQSLTESEYEILKIHIYDK